VACGSGKTTFCYWFPAIAIDAEVAQSDILAFAKRKVASPEGSF
jgi:hypothetical protein